MTEKELMKKINYKDGDAIYVIRENQDGIRRFAHNFHQYKLLGLLRMQIVELEGRIKMIEAENA